MKSTLDPSFDCNSSLHVDDRKTFDRVWRDLDVRDDEENEPSADRNSIWLECNGDLVDGSSVKVVRVLGAGFDAEIIEFVCPRCKKPHESLRFLTHG